MINMRASSKGRPAALAGDVIPGRWLGGVAMIVAPVLVLTGMLLRLRFHFFFPAQLAAFEQAPTLVVASYSAYAAGNVLLWPAVLRLAERIGVTHPGLALWGGSLTVLGLFTRTFHAGVDHLAFQVARDRGAEAATGIVADSYGAFHVFQTLNAAILAGWIVLAIGAYRSGVLGLARCVALGLMAGVPLGVLKGTTPFSIAATAGLCLALVPLGISTLRDGPTPSRRATAGWVAFVAGVAVFSFIFGRLG